MPHDSRTKLYFEIRGRGSPLFLGPHFATCDAPWLREYLDRLTDRYRVLVIDPPGHGKSAPLPAAEFTADRLCEDFLSVADARTSCSVLHYSRDLRRSVVSWVKRWMRMQLRAEAQRLFARCEAQHR